MAQNNGNNGPPDLRFDENVCEQYLLGELSEADQERFEAAYFTDDVFFDRFMAVKTELVDLYTRGELEPKKQERMRVHFSATAPRKRHLAESQQFIDAVTNRSAKKNTEVIEPQSRPFFSFLKVPVLAWVSASVLLFIGLGIWWSSSTQPREADIAAVQPSPAPETSRDISVPVPANTDEKRDVEIEAGSTNKPAGTQGNKHQVPEGRKTPQSQGVPKAYGLQARLVLGVVATRDISDANTLRIYSDTSAVSIDLAAPGEPYKSYTADISTIAGESHWQTKQASRRVGNKLTLNVDPRALRRSDYIITLRGKTPKGGSEVVAEYYFHVVRDAQKTPAIAPPK